MHVSSIFTATLFFFILYDCHASKGRSNNEKERERKARICGRQHPSLNNRGHKLLNSLESFSNNASLGMSSAPEHKAMCWLIHTDKSGITPGSSKMKERYALAVLWFATKPEVWHTSTNWLTNESVCNWYGITCDTWGYVSQIDLGFNGLNGIIPHEVGLLSYLEELRLTANDFQGIIPKSIGLLKKLKVLQINMNGFFGSIPSSIGQLTNLRK